MAYLLKALVVGHRQLFVMHPIHTLLRSHSQGALAFSTLARDSMANRLRERAKAKTQPKPPAVAVPPPSTYVGPSLALSGHGAGGTCCGAPTRQQCPVHASPAPVLSLTW
jgi:hypothetical protein